METVKEYCARKEKEEYETEQEVLKNPLPLFQIGDNVKRTDHADGGKTYTIDKVRQYSKNETAWYIYHCIGQGWAQGWAWVGEHNIKKVI